MPARTGRSPVYASPLIIARRGRILDETRRMIGEVGIAGISMEEVAKRAGVAKRTLYNAFQCKEHLVALAINKYFEDYLVRIDRTPPSNTLQSLVDRLITVARRNIGIKNYARALMNIYFSADVDPGIHRTIHDIASKPQEAWMAHLVDSGQLQPWIDPAALTDMVVRHRYATGHAWTEGRITDDAFLRELVVGMLSFMAGATTGLAHAEIVTTLNTIDDHPALRPARRSHKISQD